jgi:hypothetical protein
MESNEPSIVEQAKALVDDTPGGPGVVFGTRRQLAAGALISVSVVFLATLGGMKPVDRWLTFALLGFVVGIPCLAAEFYMSSSATQEPQNLGKDLVIAWRMLTFRFVADFVGFIGAAIGIVSYVGHLASWAALVFALVIPSLFVLYGALLYLIGLAHALRERGRNAPPGN